MRTIRVRIACAVDSSGIWSASGYTGQKEEDAFDFICDDLSDGEARYFIEATVEVPDSMEKVIEAVKVEKVVG